MKNIIFIFSIFLIINGCRPNSSSEIVYSVKDTGDSLKNLSLNLSLDSVRKKVMDSLILQVKPKPWYSSKDLKISPGIVHDFMPSEIPEGGWTGPRYVIMMEENGQLRINKVDYKTWAILEKGNIVK